MKAQSQILAIASNFAAMIKTKFSRTIKVLIDNAMEYRKTDLAHFLSLQGTVIRRSYPGTSKQNGCVKCKHTYILETTRAVLIS